eukprot:scaffold86231_cov37-Cyclotella_meneghiniana.AAC.1
MGRNVYRNEGDDNGKGSVLQFTVLKVYIDPDFYDFDILYLSCTALYESNNNGEQALISRFVLSSRRGRHSRGVAFKNEQWPSPLLPYPLSTQIQKWEGTRQQPISSIGRLDAVASVDVHSHFNIEGATNHFPPRTGVKMPSSLLRYPLGTQG